MDLRHKIGKLFGRERGLGNTASIFVSHALASDGLVILCLLEFGEREFQNVVIVARGYEQDQHNVVIWQEIDCSHRSKSAGG